MATFTGNAAQAEQEILTIIAEHKASARMLGNIAKALGLLAGLYILSAGSLVIFGM